MARMTREFSLVLLGAGMLTAGSFLWPEEDLEAAARKEADQQVAAASSHGGRSHYHPILFLHRGYGTGASASSARVSFTRGGFGATGARISGVT